MAIISWKGSPNLSVGLFLMFLILCFGGTQVKASEASIDTLRVRLEKLIKEVPALDYKVTISVTDVSIDEFLRAIANSSGLNVNVDPSLNDLVVNNFSDVRVLDVLLFLSEQYKIEITIIGNIINISKPEKQVEVLNPETIGVKFDSINQLYSFDYRDEDLKRVARELTKFTDNNVILAPGLEKTIVSGFIKEKPFESALEKFAFTNNLVMRLTEDQYYILETKPLEIKDPPPDNRRQAKVQAPKEEEYILDVQVFTNGRISINALGAPISEAIRMVSEKALKSYFFSTPIDGMATLQITGATYEEFLDNILKGSQGIYQYASGIYVIGQETARDLKDFSIVQFQNRTVDDLSQFIPEDLSEGIIIKEFTELNSFILSGSNNRVEKLEGFLRQIDKLVPLVLIEVIIVDFNKSYTIATGIEAGIADQPVESRGKVFPEVDIQLGSETINKMINNFNGFGMANIGHVNENFYLTLKAMEDQGILKIRSTPKLSTLNGHEASMTIGEVEYYMEEKSNIIGTQNPQVETVKIYRPVNAQLTVNIKPIVSGDEQVTLTISVEQSDFTERISKFAPPGTVTRKFESVIRVRNQEMILLGGLEEQSKRESSSGVPFLSRIPILKWIFSSRTKSTGESKLNIFIRPTIIA